MSATAAIVEFDTERDRKTCISLDLKVTGANRELAQWLLDHPCYPANVVAEWLGCGKTRIQDLRMWARRGFEGTVFNPQRAALKESRPVDRGQLKSLDNSEKDGDLHVVTADDGLDLHVSRPGEPEVAPPEQIEDNLFHYLDRMNHFARTFRKLFKASTFDREAEVRMYRAIERTLLKWRSTQATLTGATDHVENKQ